MPEKSFYAAHWEGEFSSAEAALKKVGLTAERIAFFVQNAKVSMSPAIFAPINADYGVVVTESEGRFILWRGFYGARGTVGDAKDLIAQFKANGVEGAWAIFEWTSPVTNKRN